MFITFFDNFVEYRDGLAEKKQKSEREAHILASVNLLLSTIATDYRTTLATIDRMKALGEIKFDLLYALLVPRSIFVANCAITGKPRLFKLMSVLRTNVDGKSAYQLYCESFDLVDRVTQGAAGVGKVQTTILIHSFKGTMKIQDLDVYPLKYHPEPEKLRAALLQRGKKWMGLIGVHHMQYSGIAAVKSQSGKLMKHNVSHSVSDDPSMIYLTRLPAG